jgi:glycosyltransferase involved in cell wall biosynthesis
MHSVNDNHERTKLKVCFVSFSYYPPNQGQTAHYEYSQNVADLGHKVNVVAGGVPGAAKRENLGSVFLDRVPMPSMEKKDIPMFVFRLIKFFWQTDDKYDLIHCFYFRGVGLLPLFSRMASRKWIVDIRSPILGQKRVPLRSFLTRLETKIFDQVLVHSSATGMQIFDNAEKYLEVPIGVNLDIFNESALNRQDIFRSLKKEDTIFLYVGSLSNERRVDVLLKGFASAQMQLQHLKLVILGDGSEREKLEKLAVHLGLSKDVIFMGQVPYANVPGYVVSSDICVAYVPKTPQYMDAPVLKTLEYLAAGKPVIATSTNWHRNLIVHKKNGFLVDDQSDALVDAIISLARDSTLRETMIANARLTVQSLAWKQIVCEKMLPIYENLLGENSQGAITR